MKTEIKNLLARESEWQKSRADLPWEEKLRQSLLLRETARQLRRKENNLSQISEKRDDWGTTNCTNLHE